MEIYNKEFYRIFEENFNFQIVDTPLGRAIQMPARDAYIYSTITGSGYLENPNYPYTPRGLTKLFYSAFNYKFVTGLFDNVRLLHTPYLMKTAKPFIFSGDKFVIPVEFTKDIDLTESLNSMYLKVSNPEDYIIQRIECRKKGNGMEPFFEYLTAEYFKKGNYIVETQIPLAHSTGSPDFGGYRINSTLETILQNTTLSGGFHIIELAMLRQDNRIVNNNSSKLNGTDCLIVGEAKTSTKTMDVQLDKYMSFGVFDKGYEITPLKHEPHSEKYGLVTINEKFKVTLIEPTLSREISELLHKKEYSDWLKNYFKFYLIANLTNDELDDYFQEVVGNPIKDQLALSTFITSCSAEDIIKRIKKVENGTI